MVGRMLGRMLGRAWQSTGSLFESASRINLATHTGLEKRFEKLLAN